MYRETINTEELLLSHVFFYFLLKIIFKILAI